MAAKQQPYTTLQEQVDHQQHPDNFQLQPSGNQGEQAGYQPPQASYPPQQGGYQPPQASYPPQQGSDAPQQASYPPQQGPQQGGYPPQQVGYPPQLPGYPSEQASYRPPEAGYLPQQGYSQPPPQQQVSRTQVINQQPGVMENTADATFGVLSVMTVCPHCRVTVATTTHYVPGITACLCCCLFGVFACCCLDEIMDVQHDCPLCKNKIAVYEQSC